MQETVTRKNFMGNNVYSHPSYGMLGFSHVCGSQMELFGSSIKHDNVIALELKHADCIRELHENRHHGNKTIARVEMSYSQFAELISSFDIGDGIPVTIRYTEKDGIAENPSFIGEREKFQEEFSDLLTEINKEIHDSINSATEILSKKSINKSDREELMNKLKKIEMQMSSNAKFIYKQFNRQMEKTVTEAKGEVEAFVQNKMHSLALEAISKNSESIEMNSLIEIEDIDHE